MPPTTKIRKRRICLEPLARKCLHGLYVLSQRGRRRERNEDMHMVGHTADAIYFPVQVVGLLHDDGIEFPFMLGRDGLLALIGAENNMIYGLYVTHGMVIIPNISSGCGHCLSRAVWRCSFRGFGARARESDRGGHRFLQGLFRGIRCRNTRG